MLFRLTVLAACVLISACSSKKEQPQQSAAAPSATGDAGASDGAAPAWAAAAATDTKDVCIHLADLLMTGAQASGGHDLGRCRAAWKANAACANHDAMRACVLAARALPQLRDCPKCEPPAADSDLFCTWAAAPALGLYGNAGVTWVEQGCAGWPPPFKQCLSAAGADPLGQQVCLAEHRVAPPENSIAPTLTEDDHSLYTLRAAIAARLAKGEKVPPKAGPTPAVGACCKAPKEHCPASDDRWGRGPWKQLGWRPPRDHRYSYSYELSDSELIMRAFADADCDGEATVSSATLARTGETIAPYRAGRLKMTGSD